MLDPPALERPMPMGPNTRKIATFIPADIADEVERLAAADRRSMSQWIAFVVEDRVREILKQEQQKKD